jgi:hypothetical protein
MPLPYWNNIIIPHLPFNDVSHNSCWVSKRYKYEESFLVEMTKLMHTTQPAEQISFHFAISCCAQYETSQFKLLL